MKLPAISEIEVKNGGISAIVKYIKQLTEAIQREFNRNSQETKIYVTDVRLAGSKIVITYSNGETKTLNRSE